MSWLSAVFGRRTARSDAHIVRLAETPALIFAIGDVHGCLDELRALEAKIIAHAKAVSGPKLLVYIGDLVDRGKDSAGVLEHVFGAPPPGFTRLALRGNHEEMFVEFLEKPSADADWLRHGGLETLASYGIYPAADGTIENLADKLAAHIPGSHLAGLRAMPSALICGSYYFCHAGIDAKRAPEAQLVRDLHWNTENAADQGWFDLCVVHGHVIVEAPELSKTRIGLDTGAYLTGQLSAVALDAAGSVKILQTDPAA